MRNTLLLAALALTLVPACKTSHAAPLDSNKTPAKKAAPPKAAPDKSTEIAAATKPKAPVDELVIASVKNLMKYDKTKLTAKAGDEVHLVFHNNATSAVLPHNWVLVKPGTQATVAAAGLKKGKAAGYLAPGPDILAATPLAQPGKTVSVEFKAPAPGTYPYICTVPGHYVVMNGQLVVTP